MLSSVDRYVIARENNVVRVDFSREPDPPGPYFPGANGLRLSDAQRDGEEPPSAEMFRNQKFRGVLNCAPGYPARWRAECEAK